MTTRFVICGCILLMGLLPVSCGTGPAGEEGLGSDGSSRVVTVFLTGNGLGTLKPCGCSGGQLGGFSRRSAVFKSVPAGQRVVIDTGSLVEEDGPQDLIKFNVILRAFGLLGYDLVNLNKKDVEMAVSLGLLGNMSGPFGVISSAGSDEVELPARFSKRLSSSGRTVVVEVGSLDLRAGWTERLGGLFGPGPDERTVRILILDGCEPGKVRQFTKDLVSVDCIICPGDVDERPRIIGEAEARPLVVSVGRLGKYVGRLDIAGARRPFKLAFGPIAVTEDLPEDPALIQWYGEYQVIVKESGLLAGLGRISLPGGLKYAGSASCKPCHGYEYSKWSEQGHARAYATLERVGSDYDPECVVCHTVGMRYESGFVSPEVSPGLRDVGCENCHGPGSRHIDGAGTEPPGEPRFDCEACHTPDNSANYSGNEAEYFEKIIHWREPNTAGNVQKGKR